MELHNIIISSSLSTRQDAILISANQKVDKCVLITRVRAMITEVLNSQSVEALQATRRIYLRNHIRRRLTYDKRCGNIYRLLVTTQPSKIVSMGSTSLYNELLRKHQHDSTRSEADKSTAYQFHSNTRNCFKQICIYGNNSSSDLRLRFLLTFMTLKNFWGECKRRKKKNFSAQSNKTFHRRGIPLWFKFIFHSRSFALHEQVMMNLLHT